MRDDKSHDIQTYPWEHIPKDIYLYVIFPRLSFEKLEKLAENSEFFGPLVNRYRGTLSVLEPTKPDDDNYFSEGYNRKKIDAAHKAFLAALFETPKTFSPDPINLDYYQPLCVNESDRLNILQFLYRHGNRELLRRIYDFACQNITTHESFGFHTDAPITDYFSAETEKEKLDNFVRAQWAICTYQSPQEFDKHFAAMGELTEPQKYAVQEKLLQYAFDTDNQMMVQHLCLNPKYFWLGELCEMGLEFKIKSAIEHGVDINAAFVIACKQEFFNIDTVIALLELGVNPLAALQQQARIDQSNIRRVLPYMLWQYNKENSSALKSRVELRDAMRNVEAHQTNSVFDQVVRFGNNNL